ncbi:signal recognition particle protein Srp54 [Candidatus Woesearchaeota archaeon]|nr:signal recognition particle protein Srp54 [Candidatus Woesearchaeota archaeon]
MVLEKLGDSLKNTLGKIAKSLFVDEKLVNELVKDIQKALLSADVNVKLVFELTKKIKERALKEKLPKGLDKREHLVNIVYEELTNFLGKDVFEIKIDKKPTKIMLVGLFGNGKTTTAGKLAKFYKKRGYKIALIQTDTWRPAAYEQLQQLSKQVGCDFFGIKGEKDPVKIYKKFEDKIKKYDLVIVDTAGRDALSDDLIEELNLINKVVKADERLLVISADIGQAAQLQAEKFHETVNVSGVIITRLDGTAKGGGALSACSIADAPVKFIGIGEKLEEFELFNPKRFVGRLLGMGDIESLLEKAKEAIPQEKAEDLGARFLKGDFTLVDLYEQMKAMKKMGSISKLMEMIPGFSKIKMPKELLEVQEGKLEKWKVCMDSMTQKELEDPSVIDRSRMDRIAKGAGCSTQDIRDLIKQYNMSKKMSKMLKGGKNLDKMMKKFGGQIPGM